MKRPLRGSHGPRRPGRLVPILEASDEERAAVPRPPDVRGLTEQEAISNLEDAGYRVASAHFPVEEGDDFVECYVPTETARVVIGQRPRPGLFSSAPEGSWC
jgi:hypothetical protein